MEASELPALRRARICAYCCTCATEGLSSCIRALPCFTSVGMDGLATYGCLEWLGGVEWGISSTSMVWCSCWLRGRLAFAVFIAGHGCLSSRSSSSTHTGVRLHCLIFMSVSEKRARNMSLCRNNCTSAASRAAHSVIISCGTCVCLRSEAPRAGPQQILHRQSAQQA